MFYVLPGCWEAVIALCDQRQQSNPLQKENFMNDKVTIKGDEFRIILLHEKNKGGSRTIDVCTSKNGSLTVGGYDLGPAVEKHFGRIDYEYDASVDTEDKYSLFVALKKDLFKDKDDFKSWIADKGIVDVKADFNVVLLLMLKKLGLFPHDFSRWAREHEIEVHFWSN
jgi:hypothetical protein